jgi:hypothetical protein
MTLNLTKAEGSTSERRRAHAVRTLALARSMGQGLMIVGGLKPDLLAAAVHVLACGCRIGLSKPRTCSNDSTGPEN